MRGEQTGVMEQRAMTRIGVEYQLSVADPLVESQGVGA